MASDKCQNIIFRKGGKEKKIGWGVDRRTGGLGRTRVGRGILSAEGCSRIRVEGRVNARRGSVRASRRRPPLGNDNGSCGRGTRRKNGERAHTRGETRACGGRVSMFVIARGTNEERADARARVHLHENNGKLYTSSRTILQWSVTGRCIFAF